MPGMQRGWCTDGHVSQRLADYYGARARGGVQLTITKVGISSLWCPSDPTAGIMVNLGGSYSVTDLYYLPRQDSQNGRIANYQVYVSADGVNWGNPVATEYGQRSCALVIRSADAAAVRFGACRSSDTTSPKPP